VRQAERLANEADPKLDSAVKVLKPLIAEGANPVVFCRFIATADHVAAGLRKAFPRLRIETVTGELTPEERRARVDAMADAEQRLLVATDCLSEGINLQHLFDTVIHYDLSWNPTRHQQREGRVDRFGQPCRVVRSVLLFSPDSAIDGAVLEVILRKAEAIRKATGVTVPLPDERGAVTGALMNAVLLRKGRGQQLSLDFGLGADAAVDAPLEPHKPGVVRAHFAALPAAIAARLAARGLEGTLRLAFEEPPPAGSEMVGRSHPLPATLAETLLEGALDTTASPVPALGRAGAWPTPAVKVMTTVALIRLRFKLTVHGRHERLLLAEEAGALAWQPSSAKPVLIAEGVRALLEHPASGDLAPVARRRLLQASVERIGTALEDSIAAYARERASVLAEDHARVRAAASGSARVTVEPVLPCDIIGLYVLVPAGV
jgi:hypothetical protein